jgi:AraC-like DNA-binding protein
MSADTTPTLDELAAQIGLSPQLVRDLFDNGLISLSAAERDVDLRELRRARRLRDDLELQHAAITIILRLRQRTLALQHEVAQLRRVARIRLTTRPSDTWSDAEWILLDDER